MCVFLCVLFSLKKPQQLFLNFHNYFICPLFSRSFTGSDPLILPSYQMSRFNHESSWWVNNDFVIRLAQIFSFMGDDDLAKLSTSDMGQND